MRILIVEDTVDSRVVFKTMLESLGHEVLEADGGKVAISIAANNKPDLVLMDLRMPGCDGLIGTGAMRTIHGLDSVRRIAHRRYQRDRVDLVQRPDILGLCRGVGVV